MPGGFGQLADVQATGGHRECLAPTMSMENATAVPNNPTGPNDLTGFDADPRQGTNSPDLTGLGKPVRSSPPQSNLTPGLDPSTIAPIHRQASAQRPGWSARNTQKGLALYVNQSAGLSCLHPLDPPRRLDPLRAPRRRAAASDPALGEEITIRLRAGLDVPVERVLIRTCPDGEQLLTPMQAGEPGPACRWWRATLHLTMPSTGYRFLLFTADGVWWYNGTGLHRHTPTDADDFRLLAGYAAPAWVRDSVFYQIFPDRFADGDPASNVRDGEFEYRGLSARARRWGEPPLPDGHPATGRVLRRRPAGHRAAARLPGRPGRECPLSQSDLYRVQQPPL